METPPSPTPDLEDLQRRVAFRALLPEGIHAVLSDEQRQLLATEATAACVSVLQGHHDLRSRLITDAVEHVLREA